MPDARRPGQLEITRLILYNADRCVSNSEFREVCHAVFGPFMIVFLVVLVVMAAVGFWMKKKEAARAAEEQLPEKDSVNRARYQDQDGN